MKFVSRAGDKFEHAVGQFKLDLKDKVCADFGCSTGGFTDCMLQNGAKKVYSIDTGYGVLDWKLRNDQRVVVMERENAMYVNLPEKMDLISIDTSWTKQKFILPNALKFLKPGGIIVSLIKPHYEAEKNMLVKGKVKDEYVEEVVNKVVEELKIMKINVIEVLSLIHI